MKGIEAIIILQKHKKHWQRLLKENICDKQEGEQTIKALTIAIQSIRSDIFFNNLKK